MMSIVVADDLGQDVQRYMDSVALLRCDNPDCSTAWVTHARVVAWEQADAVPRGSYFTTRILVGCREECLLIAQERTRNPARWSEPMSAGA